MAQITSIDEIGDGSTLSAEQLQAIINKIDVNIYNILDGGKNATMPYTEFGDVGHKKDPAAGIAALMRIREKYEMLLNLVPGEQITQFDNPGF